MCIWLLAKQKLNYNAAVRRADIGADILLRLEILMARLRFDPRKKQFWSGIKECTEIPLAIGNIISLLDFLSIGDQGGKAATSSERNAEARGKRVPSCVLR